MSDKKNPDEIELPASKLTVSGNIIVPLILLAIINMAFVWKQQCRPLLWHDYVARYKQQMAAQTYQPPLEIIFLGDSTGNQSVTESIYDKLDMPGKNLCTFANVTIAADAWILDSYLKHNPAPKIVTLVHSFKQPIYDSIEPSMLNKLSVRSESGFKPDFSGGDELEAWCARWLPLYFDRTTVQKCYKRPWLFAESFCDFRWDDSGCMIFDQTWLDKIDSSVDRHGNCLSNPAKLSPLNTAALLYILKLADKYDFDIIYTQGPHYRPLGDKDNFPEFCQSLWDQIAQLSSPAGRHIIVNRQLLPMNLDEMGADAIHVNIDGARRFTSYLSGRIAELTQTNSSEN